MKDEVTAFQLGSSTVITIPKGMGIRPGQKMKIKKNKNGDLKLEKKESLLELLEKTRGAWADMDWEEYDRKEKERRKLELKAAREMKKAW